MMRKWTPSQSDAIEKSGANLIVSASAGSGKTAVLVERVVRHVLAGGDVKRLVVLTFTKDSAREMRERVLEELLQKIRLDPENAHLREQADILIFANITTIDGYCLDLVKRYFNELNEESALDLLSEDEEAVLLSAAADDTISAFFESGDETFYALLDRFIEKRDVKALKEILFSLHRFLGVQAEREEFISLAKRTLSAPFEERATTVYLLRRFKRRAAGYRAAIEAAAREVETSDLKFLNFIGAIVDELSELSTAPTFRAFGRTAKSFRSNGVTFQFPGVKKAFPEAYLKVKAIRDEAKEFMKQCVAFSDVGTLIEKEDSVARFSTLLLELSVKTDERYRNAKREREKLDFIDVERLAYRVLSDNARREEISSEIDAVFLDEYQDTNRLQESVLMRLSKGGNVFMVGDPKQAIYRFRLAEPGIFVGKYRRYAERDGGEKVDLNENFRSDPRILRFVNEYFSDLMTREFGGVDYRSAACLKAGRTDDEERYRAATRVPVEISLYEPERAERASTAVKAPYSVRADTVKTPEKRDREGLKIAAKIKKILGESIFDAKIAAPRPIRCRDIAVIVPKNKNAAKIRATLLRRGIPATLSGRGKEGENPDVTLLTAYLSAASNRKNDVPLLLAVASPLGGFSAEELAEIRLAKIAADRTRDAQTDADADCVLHDRAPKKYKNEYFWESIAQYSGSESLQNKVARFFESLDAVRRMSSYLTVSELFPEALRLTGYDAYLMGEPDGAERLQKLNLYFETLKGKDYAVRLSDYLAEAADLPTDLSPPAADGDAVRVMTFHASKGLEFPVVFVAHAGDAAKEKPGRRTFFDKEFGVAVQYFDNAASALEDTIFTRAFREKERSEQREEALRLVYVALTRAKNRLYVIGKEAKSPGLYADDCASFSAWFEYAAEKNPQLRRYLCDLCEDDENVVLKSEPPITTDSAERADLNADYPHKKAVGFGVKYTVSELNASMADEDFVPTYALGAAGGKEEGIAYHKVFQYIDFEKRTAGDVAAELDRLVSEGVLTEEEARGIDLARVAEALRSDLFSAANEGEMLREQPFMLYLSARDAGVEDSDDKILVQGVIDLLIVRKKPDGTQAATLVDYKSTALNAESAAAKYKNQLRLYRTAAERILKIPVEKTVLYLVRSGESVEVNETL